MSEEFLFGVLLKLGATPAEEQIVGGALVFLVVGLGTGYLAYVRDEFEAGPVLKVGTVLILLLALLAFFWPSRPWPH